MKMHREVMHNKAQSQWVNLYNILSNKIGAEVVLTPPGIGMVDMVFSANAALVIKAINGTADGRITYGNASGPGSSGTGVQGITAIAGSSSNKITLKMDGQGTTGNISNAVAHGAGAVNLVDVADFSGGTADDIMLYRLGIRGPANIRNRNQAYKVTVGATSAT